MRRDTRGERIVQLYESALEAMKKYSNHIEYNSCEEYLSADPEMHNPITLTYLSSYICTLQSQINKYDCCIDDTERARVGMEILYWCRNLGRHDCIAKEQRDER